MTESVPPAASRASFGSTLRAGLSVGVQVMIGAMLLAVAGLVAVMTALAGLLLGAAALVMRFARAPAPVPVRIDDAPMTLTARRTPRGWTVE